jgi:hypothetical protein
MASRSKDWGDRNPEKLAAQRRRMYAKRQADPEHKAKDAAAQRARYKRNRERVLSAYSMRKYGIDIATKRSMEEQQGGCAVCQQRIVDPRKMAIDHDHANGMVRQVLCAPCNLMLGCARDNPETLKRAASYVELWRWLHSMDLAPGATVREDAR